MSDLRRKSHAVDSISKRKKEVASKVVPKVAKKKKTYLFGIILVLILLPVLLLASFIGANKAKGELDVFKIFSNGKYLVLFQNNSELRPSGGFIGSFAVVEFENYRIKNINFNSNIYKLDNAFTSDHIIPPPEPLKIISNNRWSMRDSNFAVSFPDSAEKVEWFYNQESGDKVDGVITVNASLISDLLKITGPINLENPETQITSDNFFTELTTQIESQYYQNGDNKIVNEPKTILTELMPIVFKKAMNLSKIKLGQLAINALKNKDIMFYSNNTNLQTAILDKNWGGAVTPTSGDYLYINSANIGGGKSSLNVIEDINYKVSGVSKSLISDLTLTRTHLGTGVWPDKENNNYTKVLVPKGSILKSALLNGKDITAQTEVGSEAGKTYFATLINTAPSSSTVLKLNYQLPELENTYQLLMQKQSGNMGDTVTAIYQNKIFFDGILSEDKLLK